MKAVIPDKRRHASTEEDPIVCAQCAFPMITIESETGKSKGIAYADGPVSEEGALAIGWTESELGLICPICTGYAALGVAQAEAEGAFSSVGTGGMATALAGNIAEAQGEKFEGQIDEVALPETKPDVTVALTHTLVLDPDYDMDKVEIPSGTATCSRCKKTWKYELEGDAFITETPYDRACAFVPEVQPKSEADTKLESVLEEKTNE